MVAVSLFVTFVFRCWSFCLYYKLAIQLQLSFEIYAQASPTSVRVILILFIALGRSKICILYVVGLFQNLRNNDHNSFVFLLKMLPAELFMWKFSFCAPLLNLFGVSVASTKVSFPRDEVYVEWKNIRIQSKLWTIIRSIIYKVPSAVGKLFLSEKVTWLFWYLLGSLKASDVLLLRDKYCIL